MNLYAGLTALGVFLGASGAWYIQDLRWTRTEALYKAAAASALEQAISTARGSERSLQARADASARLYEKLKEKTDRESADLQRRISNGVRLTAPGTCTASAAPSPTPEPDAPGTCELSAGTSADLAALAGRADSCAIRLNSLQEYVRGLFEGAQDGTIPE